MRLHGIQIFCLGTDLAPFLGSGTKDKIPSEIKSPLGTFSCKLIAWVSHIWFGFSPPPVLRPLPLWAAKPPLGSSQRWAEKIAIFSFPRETCPNYTIPIRAPLVLEFSDIDSKFKCSINRLLTFEMKVFRILSWKFKVIFDFFSGWYLL